VWSRESNEFGWRSYLGDLYGSADLPYHAAPARCSQLAGLPPSYVCVGGADGFRDEDIEYALRLTQASVPTELHLYPGAPHGVSLFVGTDVPRRYQRDTDAWLGRQLDLVTGENAPSCWLNRGVAGASSLLASVRSGRATSPGQR
jgi:acetyl esterase/lipase